MTKEEFTKAMMRQQMKIKKQRAWQEKDAYEDFLRCKRRRLKKYM